MDIDQEAYRAERATNLEWRVSNICDQGQHRAPYSWPPFPGIHNESGWVDDIYND